MTAFAAPVRRPFSHRIALRAGRALTTWGARAPRPQHDAERVSTMEAARDHAARTLPQLPR
ncbi:hypothetical protein P5G50_11820 [Leifsonia sp. F6_8S_P_1B]|uniref:Uncharacterized protein n=1 Tax=Leifsonia williamsii TaxID=3035919 RepID=A0ABT8KCE7_9MICO|nr:hypothetical protein [Leifsonia williamsii]MDN4615135.1 hypothetical protein [Leifsonia williamsii]